MYASQKNEVIQNCLVRPCSNYGQAVNWAKAGFDFL